MTRTESLEKPQVNLPKTVLTVARQRLKVQIADTPATREAGLMYRTSIAPNEGMLFVFDDVKIRCFWMKNTFIPLSIAYLDANKQILSLHDMQPLSQHTLCSTQPAKYALEVSQGWYSNHNIKVGDIVQ